MVAGTVEVRDERANNEELLRVQCGHFAHSFPGDCLVVHAIAARRLVVDRGHFEVGARERGVKPRNEKQIPSWRGKAPVRPRRQGRRGVAFIGAQRKPLHGRSGRIRHRVQPGRGSRNRISSNPPRTNSRRFPGKRTIPRKYAHESMSAASICEAAFWT